MSFAFQLVLLISLITLGLCELPQQQQDVQFTKLQGWVPIKVRRTFRSMNPTLRGNGLLQSSQNYQSLGSGATTDYSILRQRAPRWYFGNYQQLPFYTTSPNMLRSYRPYRSGLPLSLSPDFDSGSGEEVEATVEQPSSDQISRLRFLGWLFGRPSMSSYPDYSMLEQAAGIYGSRLPSVPYSRPYSPVVVEECVELLDPYTDHVVEECREIPSYH